MNFYFKISLIICLTWSVSSNGNLLEHPASCNLIDADTIDMLRGFAEGFQVTTYIKYEECFSKDKKVAQYFKELLELLKSFDYKTDWTSFLINLARIASKLIIEMASGMSACSNLLEDTKSYFTQLKGYIWRLEFVPDILGRAIVWHEKALSDWRELIDLWGDKLSYELGIKVGSFVRLLSFADFEPVIKRNTLRNNNSK